MALSGDGSTLAVGGAWRVYVFKDWRFPSTVEGAVAQQNQDNFGSSVALNEYGTVLAVGAPMDLSAGKGINSGTAEQVKMESPGAAYLFEWAGGAWARVAYVKASNTDAHDTFGWSVALSGDGRTLAVGAMGESSSAAGINGDQENNSLSCAGAAYVFTKSVRRGVSTPTSRPRHPAEADQFGANVALSGDGAMLVVGAPSEASPATGINGSQEGADGPPPARSTSISVARGSPSARSWRDGQFHCLG